MSSLTVNLRGDLMQASSPNYSPITLQTVSHKLEECSKQVLCHINRIAQVVFQPTKHSRQLLLYHCIPSYCT